MFGAPRQLSADSERGRPCGFFHHGRPAHVWRTARCRVRPPATTLCTVVAFMRTCLTTPWNVSFGKASTLQGRLPHTDHLAHRVFDAKKVIAHGATKRTNISGPVDIVLGKCSWRHDEQGVKCFSVCRPSPAFRFRATISSVLTLLPRASAPLQRRPKIADILHALQSKHLVKQNRTGRVS